jgi:hypothetical protein
VAALRPKKLIPTVNVSDKFQAAALVERFVDCMDLSSNRGRLDMFLVRRPASSNSQDTQPSGQLSGQLQEVQQQQQQQQQVVQEQAHEQHVLGNSGSIAECEGACSCSPRSSNVLAQVEAQVQLQQEARNELADPAGSAKQMPIGSSSACEQEDQQQQQQLQLAEQHVDLAGVDVAEQQRLLDEAQRLLRLKRSWAAVKAAGKASGRTARAAGRRRSRS